MAVLKNANTPIKLRYGVFWGSMLVLLFFVILFVSAFSLTPNGFVNAEVLLTFAVNGGIGVIALLHSIRKWPYSLAIMHWVFYLLFFVFSPVIQYIWGSFPWYYSHSDAAIIQGNLMLTAWAIIVWIMQYIVIGSNNYEINHPKFLSAGETVPILALDALIILSALITLYLIRTVGFTDLFARSTYELLIDSSAIRQIVEKMSRATVTFTFVACILRYKANKDCILQLFISFTICLVACFPAGMPRYSAAAIWGGIILVAFPVFKEKRILFPALFIIAFLVIFPAINVYKGLDFRSGNLLEAIVGVMQNFFGTFLEVSYDAYSLYLRTIIYVNYASITWGYQLLGAILFFIPRAVWPSKPFGSGATVVAAQGQKVTNVACPLPAEAFINFGVVGLLLGALLVGILIKKFDDYYWKNHSLSLFVTVSYPQLLFFFFFMMRGDLLSTFAYTTAFMVTNFILANLCRVLALHISKRKSDSNTKRRIASGLYYD